MGPAELDTHPHGTGAMELVCHTFKGQLAGASGSLGLTSVLVTWKECASPPTSSQVWLCDLPSPVTGEGK